MIVGSGLLAQAFYPFYLNRADVCIYAAGVSNSNCVDEQEFNRDKERLQSTLNKCAKDILFVYFGTCSISDPEMFNTPYLKHKIAMEDLVQKYPNYLIFRLPQVAGRTPNPHTLLNYLYARISRSESFNLWINAKRNIIDIDDITQIATQIIEKNLFKNKVINIANPVNYRITEIVQMMEGVVGKKAIFKVIDRGSEYLIDINGVTLAGVNFDEHYLSKLITKYYAYPETRIESLFSS